jgi:hypothetical protein
MTELDYAVVIERLPEADGGGYVAHGPDDLPGCMSADATPVGRRPAILCAMPRGDEQQAD